ncbi:MULTISPECIES: hypothetical protein [unclassified Streptomyces]|uniref:hypothetical protein n=1 Tax=unclassified Streptomyces TaxID=2593676 RepID=UPI000C276DDB|nr:hypothetical protein [Streptomyces sp. CB01373]PJM93516.1 hypothetical protein CG719_21580 [Streptomyces sp. CB01373]
MRIRRILAAVIATAALAGLGLTGAATATAQGGGSGFTTPSQCREGGGQPYLHNTVKCWGGKYDGMTVD